jgi:hypothetical protein
MPTRGKPIAVVIAALLLLVLLLISYLSMKIPGLSSFQTLALLATACAVLISATVIILRYKSRAESVEPTSDGSHPGKTKGDCGIARDIADRNLHEQEHANTLERISRQQAAIVKLATSQVLASGVDLASAAAVLTETAAEALEVDRVGFWKGGPQDEELECIDLYDRRHRKHSNGSTLKTGTCPIYLDALASDRVIDAADAQHDPRTVEFNRDYHVPFGLKSVLDAPVRIGGRVVGVICHEHSEAKLRWLNDEILFAGQIAD